MVVNTFSMECRHKTMISMGIPNNRSGYITALAVIYSIFIKEKGYFLKIYCFGGKILPLVCLFHGFRTLL
jgi:hypothetical protein